MSDKEAEEIHELLEEMHSELHKVKEKYIIKFLLKKQTESRFSKNIFMMLITLMDDFVDLWVRMVSCLNKDNSFTLNDETKLLILLEKRIENYIENSKKEEESDITE